MAVSSSLGLLAHLVLAALPDRFPSYPPLRRSPFVFLGHQRQLLDGAAAAVGGLPDITSGFVIWPKYEFDTRILELRAGRPFVAVTAAISTRYEITTPVLELAAAGVDVRGLYVVRRSPDRSARPLLGRIALLDGTRLLLDDPATDEAVVEAGGAMLEGSTANFAACLRSILGERYEQFHAFCQRQVAAWTSAEAVSAEVARVGEKLASADLVLADGLTCRVTDRVVARNRDSFQTVVRARPVAYCYDPARSKQDPLAWPGLAKYGPFSRDTFARPSPAVLVVFPDENKGQVEAFLRHLFDGLPAAHSAFDKGMTRLFGLVNPAFDLVAVRGSAGHPADAYRRSIDDYLARSNRLPDAAIVVIADADATLPDPDNLYLHAKARLLMAGVACQEVLVATLRQPPQALQYTLRSLAVALYAKMGGIP